VLHSPVMTADTTTLLDVQGLSCPLPVLKANKALRGMAPGAILTVLATDPAAAKDFVAFSDETGHEILSSTTEEGGVLRFVLRRRGAP
jgi:tRNA 2-thiouridine synthesizing protein A